MRLLSVFIAFILFAFPAQAQRGVTVRAALNIPDSQTNTTTEMAAYINSHFKTDAEKVSVIYAWVTSNIKYDKNNVHRIILEEDQEQRVTYALKRRRGVCENFAAIFNDLCIKSGIPSFYIEGYTRQNGSIDRTGHVWCAALVNNSWTFYDPTWDAGGSVNYFQISPNEFISSHLPFDPMFQLLNYMVSYREFSRNSKATNSPDSYFNYKDSLSVYLDSDSLSRYVGALRRIENFDWPSWKIDIKQKQLKLEIELIYQDRDMAAYHSAIADFNTGIDILNDFIIYRNNQFQPAKKSNEVQRMFDHISEKIVSANQNLSDINKSEATLALNTGDLQQKIDDLSRYAKEQSNYYKNYLSLAK